MGSGFPSNAWELLPELSGRGITPRATRSANSSISDLLGPDFKEEKIIRTTRAILEGEASESVFVCDELAKAGSTLYFPLFAEARVILV